MHKLYYIYIFFHDAGLKMAWCVLGVGAVLAINYVMKLYIGVGLFLGGAFLALGVFWLWLFWYR